MAEQKENPPFEKGEQVTIIRGSFKHHKYGTFLCYSGTVSADVKVDNDKVEERCLRLTSIAPVATKADKTREGKMTVSSEEFRSVIDYIEGLDINEDTDVISVLQDVVHKLELVAGKADHGEDDPIPKADNHYKNKNTK